MTAPTEPSLLTLAQGLAQRPLAKSGWITWPRVLRLSLIVLVVADVGLRWNIFHAVRQVLAPQTSALSIEWQIPWILAAVILAVLVHELGHVVGALISRRRVLAVAVVPLLVTIRPFSVRFHVSLFRGDVGGFVRTDAVTGDLSRRDLPLYAGGIVANLIAWLVAREWAIAAGPTPGSAMAATFAFLNVALAIGNAVPYRMANGFRSDGKWLIDIARARPPTGLQAISTLIGRPDLRPRDWPAAAVTGLQRTPAAERRNGIVPLLLYSHALDQRRFADARMALAEVLASRPTTERFRTAYLLQAARFAAWTDRDPRIARAIIALAPHAPDTQPYLTYNALAAIEEVEGKHDVALASVAAARRAAEATGVRLAADDRDALDEVERAARRALDAAAA